MIKFLLICCCIVQVSAMMANSCEMKCTVIEHFDYSTQNAIIHAFEESMWALNEPLTETVIVEGELIKTLCFDMQNNQALSCIVMVKEELFKVDFGVYKIGIWKTKPETEITPRILDALDKHESKLEYVAFKNFMLNSPDEHILYLEIQNKEIKQLASNIIIEFFKHFNEFILCKCEFNYIYNRNEYIIQFAFSRVFLLLPDMTNTINYQVLCDRVTDTWIFNNCVSQDDSQFFKQLVGPLNAANYIMHRDDLFLLFMKKQRIQPLLPEIKKSVSMANNYIKYLQNSDDTTEENTIYIKKSKQLIDKVTSLTKLHFPKDQAIDMVVCVEGHKCIDIIIKNLTGLAATLEQSILKSSPLSGFISNKAVIEISLTSLPLDVLQYIIDELRLYMRFFIPTKNDPKLLIGKTVDKKKYYYLMLFFDEVTKKTTVKIAMRSHRYLYDFMTHVFTIHVEKKDLCNTWQATTDAQMPQFYRDFCVYFAEQFNI